MICIGTGIILYYTKYILGFVYYYVVEYLWLSVDLSGKGYRPVPLGGDIQRDSDDDDENT